MTRLPTVGDVVILGTREGRFTGRVIGVTARRGNLAIQVPGFSDLFYRNPNHVELTTTTPTEGTP